MRRTSGKSPANSCNGSSFFFKIWVGFSGDSACKRWRGLGDPYRMLFYESNGDVASPAVAPIDQKVARNYPACHLSQLLVTYLLFRPANLFSFSAKVDFVGFIPCYELNIC